MRIKIGLVSTFLIRRIPHACDDVDIPAGIGEPAASLDRDISTSAVLRVSTLEEQVAPGMVSIFRLVCHILGLFKLVEVELNVRVVKGVSSVELHGKIAVEDHTFAGIEMQVAVVVSNVEIVAPFEVSTPTPSRNVDVTAAARFAEASVNLDFATVAICSVPSKDGHVSGIGITFARPDLDPPTHSESRAIRGLTRWP